MYSGYKEEEEGPMWTSLWDAADNGNSHTQSETHTHSSQLTLTTQTSTHSMPIGGAVVQFALFEVHTIA